MKRNLLRVSLTCTLLTIFGVGGVATAQSLQQEKPSDWNGRVAEQSVSSQTPRFTLLAGPLITAPVGHYFDGFNGAAGLGLGLRWLADDHLALRATLRRSNLSEEVVNFMPLPGDAQDLLPSYRSNADLWRLSVAAEFFGNLNSGPTRHPSLLYFYLGAGLVYSNLTIHYAKYHDGLDPALSSGVGLMVMLSPKVGLEFGSSFDVVFVGGVDNSNLVGTVRDQTNAGLFDLSASLVYGLSSD